MNATHQLQNEWIQAVAYDATVIPPQAGVCTCAWPVLVDPPPGPHPPHVHGEKRVYWLVAGDFILTYPDGTQATLPPDHFAYRYKAIGGGQQPPQTPIVRPPPS